MLLPFALMLSLGAAPSVLPCEGEHVVLLPFERVALSSAEARHTEEAVRRALTRTSGLCLEPRKETVARLRAQETRRETCTEDTCRASEVKSQGAQWLVRGRVMGLGGERTVVLSLVGVDGRESRSTFQARARDPGAEKAASEAFSSLWRERFPNRKEEKTLRPWPMVLLGAGAVAVATGVGFGLAARSTQKRFSEGTGGCEGEGEAFRRCFSDGLHQGERQSHIANGLLGAGAVLGVGGAILFVWELP